MKLKPNENLSLPRTPQGEARESEREPSNSREKGTSFHICQVSTILLSGFLVSNM